MARIQGKQASQASQIADGFVGYQCNKEIDIH